MLFYLALSSFSFADGTNNAFVKEALSTTFESWIQLFLGLLRGPADCLLASKRYVLKILTIFFRDFPYFSKPYLRRLIGDIWLFFNKLPELYCKTTLEQEEQTKAKRLDDEYFGSVEEDWDSEIEGLSIQICELFLTILARNELDWLLFCGLFPMSNTLAQLLMVTKSQVKFVSSHLSLP